MSSQSEAEPHRFLALPPMSPAMWGTPDEATELGDGVRGLVEEMLGVSAPEAAGDRPDPVPSPSRLSDEDLEELAAVVGDGNVSVDDEQRLRRSRGKSTPDLLTFRRAETVDAPDAIVAPTSEEQVAELLRWCSASDVALVPFGGGTSVVGGVDPLTGPHRAALSVDLAHFDELYELDGESQIAELGAGLPTPRAEELLAEHGLSLGHFPQSFPYATIGGYAMTRSSGQNSSGYGRFDDMVAGLTVVTPVGVARTGIAPGSAAGPDLTRWFLGSEGTFGVCTRVRVRVHPVPETTIHEAFAFGDFATAAAAVRAVAQAGTRPTVIRVSDETETAVNLATTSKIGSGEQVPGCLMVTLCEGPAELARARSESTRELLLAGGGTSLGAEPAEAWQHGRFGAPVLRDALLDVGALVETLETATTWANLQNLRQAVVDALTASLESAGTPPLVMCHISHVYPTGASLSFTIAAGQDASDPIGRWREAKRAAGDAIVAAGGTITHHHAVGTDHREHLAPELGEVGQIALRAVKDALDPAGVCNPGKLLP